MSVIAVATSKEAIAQPLYILVMLGGAFALLAFIYIPYNTFGEDVKMLKDSGLTTIMVLAILVGLWTASVSVADEIEGRTAVTLLSKPISRRQFVIGKFLGIVWPLLLMFVVLGAILLITVSYKVVYDARETANPEPNLAAMLRGDDRHGARPGAGVHGNRRADGHQRGDLDAAADAAEPDDLRRDLRAGPLGAADRAVVGRPVGIRRLHRPADRRRAPGARPLQRAGGRGRRCRRADELSRAGRCSTASSIPPPRCSWR